MQIKLRAVAYFCLFLVYVNPSMAQSWKEINPSPNLFNDAIYSVVTDTAGNIYAAGKFRNIKNEVIVAKWDGSNWKELGSESALKANNIITCIAVDKTGNVYAAGAFNNSTGNYSIAKWDGLSWSEVGGISNALNPNGAIYGMTIDNSGNLYVAGGFTNIAGKQYIAKWNGTNWSESGTGINSLNGNGLIYSLTTDNAGNVYAAGHFTNSNSNYYVAKWNGNNWAELGAAVPLNANDYINCIKVDNAGNVYAGGAFKNSSGDYYIARWNGDTWSEVGSGVNSLKANGPFNAIEVNATGNIYAGGFGTNLISGTINLVQWNGNTWSEILNVGYSVNDAIRSICLDKTGNVYAAGDFINNGGHNYVIKWDGHTTSEPGSFGDNLEVSNGIYHVAVDSRGQVYAAGNFTNPVGNGYIAHWDGRTWSELGGDTASLPVSHFNLAMTTDLSGNLYVSGDFTNENGKYYIAKWDGHSWSELGDPSNPIKVFEPITLLTRDKAGNIYAGGAFGDDNGFGFGIIKWDGTDWVFYPYMQGSPCSIFADTAGNIYAGNTAYDINGKFYVEKITKNGITTLGSGATALNSGTKITALAMDGQGNLLASGLNNAGFSPYNKFVAKWDGTSWSTAGSDQTGQYAEGYVASMIADDSGYVYAASSTNGNSYSSVAKWDGKNWSELGPGENRLDLSHYFSSGCLAIDVKGNIYAPGRINNLSLEDCVAVYGKSALLLQQPEITIVMNQYCNAANLQTIKITNLPDTSWISARVTLDNVRLTIHTDSSFAFAPSSLSTGDHRLKISFSTRTDSMFIIKDFTIVTAETPDVYITASTTTVTNTDPVIITATNTVGGGTTPVFTFAKDRGIGNILQAASANNTFSLDPSLLSVGDNWIYVRMQTSEICYTTPVNIDSIKITRNTVTGIRDIDFPGQEIVVYPVPFNQQFTIKGLQVSKIYQVIIVDTRGAKIYEAKITNRSSIDIIPAIHTRENFWLTIYDHTKKRILGSIPLMKE